MALPNNLDQFMSPRKQRLHSSIYSEVIVRDPYTLMEARKEMRLSSISINITNWLTWIFDLK